MKHMETEDRLFYSWLAGFIDGEGCFIIQHNSRNGVLSAIVTVALRDDDWAIIDEIYKRTGLGSVGTRNSRPTVVNGLTRGGVAWWVTRAQECQLLIDRLRAVGGLRGKKRQDFDLWSEAVQLLCEHGGSSNSPVSGRLMELRVALQDVKRYNVAAGEEAKTSILGVRKQPRPNTNRLMHYKKLTTEQAEEIIHLHNAGEMSQKEIAAQFNVGQMAISRLVRGQYRRVGASEAAQRRLSLEQIDTMVARFKAGEKAKLLCQEFTVSAPQFYRYVNGKFDRRYHRAEA